MSHDTPRSRRLRRQMGQLFSRKSPMARTTEPSKAVSMVAKTGPWARDKPLGTVLVVEDHDATCRSVARLLGHWGWNVLTADTLESALAQIPEADVLLVDWQPWGPEVLASSQRPAVIYTGDVQRAYRWLDARGYRFPIVAKPEAGELLHEALGRAMGIEPHEATLKP